MATDPHMPSPTDEAPSAAAPRPVSRTLKYAWMLIPLLCLVQLDFLLMTHLPAWRVSYSTLAFDRTVFGTVPTVWLQNLAFDAAGTRWWDLAATVIYSTHFMVWPIAVIVLWFTSRAQFVRVAGSLLITTAAGYLTYAIFPTGPPWLAGRVHEMPHADRVVVHVLDRLDLQVFVVAFPEHSHLDLATVGAIPSLHAAYTMLFLLAYYKTGGRKWLPLLIAYVVFMALTLVYTGEHFVGDILLGWLYAAVSITLVDRRWPWLRDPVEVERRGP